nr:hypothetical protein [Neisseria weaveri]
MKTKQLLRSILVAFSLSGTVFLPLTSVYAAPYFPTTAAATRAAEKLGYKKTGQISNGQAVYEATKSAKVKGLPRILLLMWTAKVELGKLPRPLRLLAVNKPG